MILRQILFLLPIIFFSGGLPAQIDFSEKNRIFHPKLIKLDSLASAGSFDNIRSVLIAKDGKLVFEKYYNGANKDTKHNARSCTKTIATLLTGIAIDQGFLQSEQDKIFDYLKPKQPVQNPDSRKEAITIEDLLTMSSCLECDDNNQFSRGHEERMYYIENWTQFFVDLPVRAYPFDPPPSERKYGRAPYYCSAGSAAVAAVLQKAIGSDLSDFYIKNLLTPLGITDYKLHNTPEKILNTAGGSEYRSRDFLKLIQLCLQNGQWNDKQLIPADWIKKASTPKAEIQPGMEYGYLFWITKFAGKQAYFMSGNGGNKMVAIPELGLAAVITQTNYGKWSAHENAHRILEEFVVPVFEK